MLQEERSSGAPARRVAPDPPGAEPTAPQEGEGRRPVPLDDLLRVAVLTPAQAAYVAAELLDAVGSGSTPHGMFAEVTAEGRVAVAQHVEPGETSLPSLLDALVGSARQLPVHPRPHQQALLLRLEEQAAATDRPADRARALREALDDALGPGWEERVARELAALVAAFGHVLVPARGATKRPSVQAAPEMPRPPGAAPRRQDLGRRRGRLSLVLVAAAAIVLLALVGGYLAWPEPEAGVASSPDGGTSKEAETAAASRPSGGESDGAGQQKRALPALASRSAGRVREVTVEPQNQCEPGSPCPVTVTVRFTPGTTSEVISWRVGAIRNCRPPASWSPVTTVTAQPGWSTVYASSAVPVPRARDVALVAVTSSPARAQSAPVAVTGSLRC